MTIAKEQLQKMLDDQFVRQHPSVPSYAKPKPKANKSKANQLTNDIIKHITLIGGWATRVNTAGRVLNGKYITGTTKLGTPDIIACIPIGRFVGIEIKIGKDKQSDAQKQVENDIHKAQGNYYLIHNLDEWFRYYNDLLCI